MKKLIKGIIEFRKNVRPEYRETFARLALGQSPDTLFLACSDSRVVPNLFASTEPGDLFVIRNVGNILAPADQLNAVNYDSEAAAVEFSLTALNVSHIIICGHSECAAIKALLEDKPSVSTPHVTTWLQHGHRAVDRLRAGERMNAELSLHNHLSQLNVLQQLEHLRSYPMVRERERSGSLTLHGWWFDIAAAEVLAFEPEENRFVVIDEAEAARLLAQLDRASPPA